MPSKAKQVVKELLDSVDVKINGKRPWDITVYDERVYQRVLSGGSLAFGEAYVDGWWSAKAPDQLIDRLLTADMSKSVGKIKLATHILKAKLINQQTKTRSKKVAVEHYDLDNELYQLMLDPHMQYTCAYYENANTLNKAQEAKLDLVCKKLGLKKGMTVLELGCGFGGLARWMAQKYGCKVTAYNISKEQVAFGKKICKGLDVTFVLDDYRHATGQFDRVVSVGMLEHVGRKNYKTFMQVVDRCLKDGQLALFHTMGYDQSSSAVEPFIEKYIFPNSQVPSISQLAKPMERRFVVEDWHNFGQDYDRTLMAWHENFVKHWDKIKHKYDERFYRMWEYYLLSVAAGFRSRKIELWQIVVSKNRKERYHRVS